MALPVNTTLKGGTYQIKRFIASGGFGCTYEGVHTGLDKPVAIKEFFVKDFCNRDETSSEITVGVTSKTALFHKLRKKFVDEARALAKLNHPSIVSVSDVFDENGTSYYVMDYINGPSLKNIVDSQGPLTETDAVRYILQVADALEYVHKNNRLHLDVKPGNIMINAEGKAQLIDFGASKQYEEESGENTSTVAGFTVGYAPTEQMGNDIKTFTPATDVYSLGATLYNILSGIKPISAATISSGEKQKPLPPHISMVTRNAVEKAMQINKNLRPQSMAEFKELLESDDTVLPKKETDDTIYVGTVEKPTEKSGKKGSNGSSGSNNSSSSSSRAKISEPKQKRTPKQGFKPTPKQTSEPKSKIGIKRNALEEAIQTNKNNRPQSIGELQDLLERTGTEIFADAEEITFRPQEIIVTEADNADLNESEKRIIESLKSSGQYKEAYNYCVDLIQQGRDSMAIQEECNKLIPFIKKETQKDQKFNKILIIIIIAISIISILTSILLTNL